MAATLSNNSAMINTNATCISVVTPEGINAAQVIQHPLQARYTASSGSNQRPGLQSSHLMAFQKLSASSSSSSSEYSNSPSSIILANFFKGPYTVQTISPPYLI